eukprot:NODE_5051_length_705_cov_23.787197_g4888_i0.p1 GENE.NODE_5051_length_705_cov_23.787197_g4888_i0~~NODE_5051_length_705_cov_23.787197_g4888_i0.p1  ORF type:complete len:173 (-),score=36.34 NODE_5051_length_705_cov_23.787197_g4888_i0:141-659(-)
MHLSLLLSFFSVALCFTRYGIPEYPTFGNPVDCVVEEALRNPTLKESLLTCQSVLCNCINGTFARDAFQCKPPYLRNECSDFDRCYPPYLECVEVHSPGCVYSAFRQCEEHVDFFTRTCDEGAICQIGSIPKGLSAGAIFAITAGLVYTLAALIIIAIYLASRKQKQPKYEN